jgi:hypothetical protein
MVPFARATVFCLLLASAVALAPPQPPQSSRRALLHSLVGAGLAGVVVAAAPPPAHAVKSRTGLGSVFTGDYDDPNHPGCLRQVKVVGPPLRADGTRSAYPVVEVKGWDGDGDSKTCVERPERSQLWSIQGKLKNKEEASFDFSPKGGPANLAGTWDGDGIVFPDGNKWTKVLSGTPDRRPADMSTLKSSS